MSTMSGQGGAGFRSQVGLQWDYHFESDNTVRIPIPGTPYLGMFQVPDQHLWSPTVVRYTATTSAVAGNRAFGVALLAPDTGLWLDNVAAVVNGGYVHPASTTVDYVFQVDFATGVQVSNYTVYRTMPKVIASGGWLVAAYIEGADAGDRLVGCGLCVREYKGSTKVSFL